jgi:hypothetical protein
MSVLFHVSVNVYKFSKFVDFLKFSVNLLVEMIFLKTNLLKILGNLLSWFDKFTAT